MESIPVSTEEQTSHADREIRVCQACSDVIRLQHYDSGAPTCIDGHWTANCDQLSEYVHSFQPAAFGLLVPHIESNYIWQVQTGGLQCNQRMLRGVYVPLHEPREFQDNLDNTFVSETHDTDTPLINLVGQLPVRNYNNDPVDDIWALINERLPFTYTDTTALHGYPATEEAWRWIELTGPQDGQMTTTDITPLIGETVVFVYPNSD